MHHDVFMELSLIIAVAAVVSLVMRLIKQPLIIGHIITGILVGPAVFNIIASAETMEAFAKIGIALLLFIIGLGLNPYIVKEVGKVTLITGTVAIFFTTVVGAAFSMLLGFGRTESLFIGLALAFSSTIIILKLLGDKKEQSRLYGKIAIGILLLEDVVATLVLLFVTARAEGHFSITQLLFLVGKALIIMVPMFLVSGYLLPKMRKIVAGSQEFLFLFAIGWGFGLAALFNKIGFSLEIGALFAGIALAQLPYAQEISARLRPLRDFFVIVFFISLGAGLSFTNIIEAAPAAIVFSLIALILKPLFITATIGLLGYTKRTSFMVGESFGQISEFSLILIILGVSQGILNSEIIGIMTLVALITIAISTYRIIYSDQLYAIAEKHMKIFERKKLVEKRERRQRWDIVLFGYMRGGIEFVKTFEQMGNRFAVVDYDPDVVDMLSQQQVDFIYGDAMDPELVEELNLDHVKLIVSNISDHQTNLFLLDYLEKNNNSCVFVVIANDTTEAAELYEKGASYVMLPHYIGSEKISAFIKKNGFSKAEFKKFREKHLEYLQTHTVDTPVSSL